MPALTKSFSLVVSLLALGLIPACGGKLERPGAGAGENVRQTLTIKGSDTMVILAQRWAERFRVDNPNITVQVSGGGSGTGIAALLNGTCDIANSSRPIKAREREQIRAARNQDAQEFKVALDAIAIYVHSSNPVTSLTMAQLKSIFRGEITNWRDVGGPDHAIVLYSRENNSGTYAYFKEHVLSDQDFATAAQTLPGTAAVIHAVSSDPFGIGYGGIAYGSGVRSLGVAGESGQPVQPTLQNATSGTYPLARFLYLYTPGAPTETARKYIDFVLSRTGQDVVEGVGFFPLPREGASAQAPATN